LFEPSPANFRRCFAAEVQKWRGVVRTSGLTLE
jgi:hypothetical protein